MALDIKASNEFLKSVEGKYDYKTIGGGYINVVGTKAELFKFLTYAKKHKIWTYKVYTFCVYCGTFFKGIFCKQEDLQRIKKYVNQQDNLVLNASSPF